MRYASSKIVRLRETDEESLNRLMIAYDELYEYAYDAVVAWRNGSGHAESVDDAMKQLKDVLKKQVASSADDGTEEG